MLVGTMAPPRGFTNRATAAGRASPRDISALHASSRQHAGAPRRAAKRSYNVGGVRLTRKFIAGARHRWWRWSALVQGYLDYPARPGSLRPAAGAARAASRSGRRRPSAAAASPDVWQRRDGEAAARQFLDTAAATKTVRIAARLGVARTPRAGTTSRAGAPAQRYLSRRWVAGSDRRRAPTTSAGSCLTYIRVDVIEQAARRTREIRASRSRQLDAYVGCVAAHGRSIGSASGPVGVRGRARAPVSAVVFHRPADSRGLRAAKGAPRRHRRTFSGAAPARRQRRRARRGSRTRSTSCGERASPTSAAPPRAPREPSSSVTPTGSPPSASSRRGSRHELGHARSNVRAADARSSSTDHEVEGQDIVRLGAHSSVEAGRAHDRADPPAARLRTAAPACRRSCRSTSPRSDKARVRAHRDDRAQNGGRHARRGPRANDDFARQRPMMASSPRC